jgi:hypothetical protein
MKSHEKHSGGSNRGNTQTENPPENRISNHLNHQQELDAKGLWGDKPGMNFYCCSLL